MCGILFKASPGSRIAEDEFIALLRRLEPRGPDESWHATFDNVAAGFTRLSIFRTQVEISSENPSVASVLVMINGEIWNFCELAAEFSSPPVSSEYDLIRRGYLAHGIEYLSELDGMFFIGIIDRSARSAYFARDPLGIKPGFFLVDGERQTITVTSDVKTICNIPDIVLRPNVNYVSNLSVFEYSDYGDCMFRGVKQLEPQHYLRIDFGEGDGYRHGVHRYESDILGRKTVPSTSVVEEQLTLLEEAVLRRYLHAESYPVGLLLSGGIDSSILALLAQRLDLGNIVCFYMGSRDNEDFEWARWIARKTGYKLEHIEPDASKIIRNLPRYCYELSGESGFISTYLSREIKDRYPAMKVVLCGEGADELYGGYSCYGRPFQWFENFSRRMETCGVETTLMAKCGAVAKKAIDHRSAAIALLDFFLEEQLVNRHLYQLDHGFMASSLELRVPFLDLQNVAFVRTLPMKWKIAGIRGKVILRELLVTVFEIGDRKFLDRRKVGLPSAAPLREVDVESHARAIIPTAWVERHPYRDYFDSAFSMMWFDLSCLVLARGNGVVPEEYSTHDLYSAHNYATQIDYLSA